MYTLLQCELVPALAPLGVQLYSIRCKQLCLRTHVQCCVCTVFVCTVLRVYSVAWVQCCVCTVWCVYSVVCVLFLCVYSVVGIQCCVCTVLRVYNIVCVQYCVYNIVFYEFIHLGQPSLENHIE